MRNKIAIAFAIVMSSIIANASVPRYVRNAPKTPTAPRVNHRQTAMPKPSIIEPVQAKPMPKQEVPAEEKMVATVPVPTVPEVPVAPAVPVVEEKIEVAAPEVKEEAPEKVEEAPAKVMPETPAEVKPAPTIDEMDIDIASDSRVAITALLNALLADEYILAVKSQNFHWNIRNSMNFGELHTFFGKIYSQGADTIDLIAERIRALGGCPLGSMVEFIKNARLKEEIEAAANDKDMIKKLLDDSEAIIRSVRANIQKTAELGDMGTNNMLSELITKHEKMAWMLRSYLK